MRSRTAKHSFDRLERVLLFGALLILAGGLFSFLAQGVGSASNDPTNVVAKLVLFKGNVFHRRAGSFVWIPIRGPVDLGDGDSLRTEKAASATLSSAEVKQTVKESTILTVRRSEGQLAGNFELAPANFEQASAEPAPTVADQDLWWTAPTTNQTWLADGENDVHFAWASVLADRYQIEVKSGTKVEYKETSPDPNFKFAPRQAGEYEVRIVSVKWPSKVLTRRISVHLLRAPDWLTEITTSEDKEMDKPLALKWTEAAGEGFDLQLVVAGRVTWQTKTSKNSFSLASAIAADARKAASYLQVRTRGTQSARSSWSAPLTLGMAAKQVALNVNWEQMKSSLTSDGEGGFKCLQALRWKELGPAWQTVEIQLTSGNRSWRETINGKDNKFCLPRPGAYQVSLSARGKDDRLTGISASYAVRADLRAPEFTDSQIIMIGKNKYALGLLRPAGFPIEIEWSNEGTKRGDSRLGSPHDFVTPPSDVTKLRTRYQSADGQALSTWSEFAQIPKAESVRLPASIENEALKVVPIDQGPVFSRGWSSLIWSEIHWQLVTKAAYYDLELSNDGKFEGEQQTKKLRANSHLLPFKTPTLLYWRVRAVSASGEAGGWSKPLTVRFQAVNPTDPSVSTRSQLSSDHRQVLETRAALPPPTETSRSNLEPEHPVVP